MKTGGGPDPGEAEPLPSELPPRISETLILVGAAALVGALTGLLGVVFLRLLDEANGLRLALVEALRGWPAGVGLGLIMLGTSLIVGLAAWMVKSLAPNAVGSGVPYVEKILRGTGFPRHEFVLPVKFLGGLLALSSGMILGREGPMVQMGAVIGERVGKMIRGVSGIWRPLMAAGAGAGLGAAFNAPVSGTLFILEEVLRKVTPLGFVLAGTAAAGAAFVQRGIFGQGLGFQVGPSPAGPAWNLPVYAIFGLFVGTLGVVYNRYLLALAGSKGLAHRLPAVPRALGIGLLVGAVGWFLPSDIGGGDDLTQRVLSGQGGMAFLITVAVARFVLGPLCYAAATPGGIFAPIVALGALTGGAAGILLHALLPEVFPSPVAFAIVGIVAFFTACIRAPLTGMVICLEMTACFGLFLPMLAGCLGAYLLATLAKDEPVYDALASKT